MTYWVRVSVEFDVEVEAKDPEEAVLKVSTRHFSDVVQDPSIQGFTRLGHRIAPIIDTPELRILSEKARRVRVR